MGFLSKRMLVVCLVFVLCPCRSAQFETESDVVAFQVYQSYNRIHAGMELKIAVKAVIEPMWHINSHEPKGEYMIGTLVELPEDARFVLENLKYPEAVEMIFSFSDRPLSVYEGKVFITGVLPIPEDRQPGEYKIPILMTFQACNDASCLPPTTIEKEISFAVVDKTTPIQEINTEIFTDLEDNSDPKRTAVIFLAFFMP